MPVIDCADCNKTTRNFYEYSAKRFDGKRGQKRCYCRDCYEKKVMADSRLEDMSVNKPILEEQWQ